MDAALGQPDHRAAIALLWDMDGLLIDSEPLWTVAETDLAVRLGRTWTDDIKAQCIGKRLDQSVPIMLAGLGVPVTAAAVEDASAFLLLRMSELFAAELPLMPGARALLDACMAERIPCALVSSSYRVLVDACLAGLGGHPFEVSLAGDEVAEPKPSPQPYLLAASKLGLDPGSCLVLEDSVTGVSAGVAAGCVTVLIPGETVPPPELDHGWTRAASLAELSVAAVRDRMTLIA
jgi:HAD superfamily hydrolase (TIGR01509 family)